MSLLAKRPDIHGRPPIAWKTLTAEIALARY